MEGFWQVLIPTSLLHIGAVLLLLSFPVQWLTPQNSKIALWFALVGGYGVGGAAGGWLGETLASLTSSIASFTERWTAQLVGHSVGFLFFALLGIMFLRFAGKGGSGLEDKGKSKTKKVKQVAWLFAFAMLGTALAGLPAIYSILDGAVSKAGHAAISALP